jgi:hypothetical protein
MRIPDRTFVLTGWWLFVVSAGFFIIASWRAEDMVGLIGAIAFMSANIAFLIPFYRSSSHDEHDENED